MYLNSSCFQFGVKYLQHITEMENEVTVYQLHSGTLDWHIFQRIAAPLIASYNKKKKKRDKLCVAGTLGSRVDSPVFPFQL